MSSEIFKAGLLARTAQRMASIVCIKFLDTYFEELPCTSGKNRRVLNGPYEDEMAQQQHIHLLRSSGPSRL